jgi:AbrB family looped-hinge helix DNA binding protein
MEKVTVSSKGQIAIPKPIRTALNLTEGTTLTLQVPGQEIVLTKDPVWKKLAGAASRRDLMGAFAADKKEERAREDSRS